MGSFRQSSRMMLSIGALFTAGCSGGSNAPIGGTHFEAVRVAQGLVQPSSMEFAPDGRIFVTEVGGAVRVVKSGGLLPAPAVTLAVSTQGERGLQSIVLDPQFGAARPYAYVYYTTAPGSLNPPATPMNRVSRFTVSGDTLTPSSEAVLLDNIPSPTGFHNGGGLQFGPDGKLYVSTGDGRVSASAQDFGSLSGKILRLNSDGTAPADNPFVGQAGKRPEIYAYGFRNPFRFTFRRSDGAMLIADVGQDTWEEVNRGMPGGNYGWPAAEGQSGNSAFVDPIYAYNHNGAAAAIIGGPWLQPNSYPAAYSNAYYYAEFVQNQVYRVTLRPDDSVQSVDRFGPPEGISGFDEQVVDLAQGPDGDLYTLTYAGGEVWRVRYR